MSRTGNACTEALGRKLILRLKLVLEFPTIPARRRAGAHFVRDAGSPRSARGIARLGCGGIELRREALPDLPPGRADSTISELRRCRSQATRPRLGARV